MCKTILDIWQFIWDLYGTNEIKFRNTFPHSYIGKTFIRIKIKIYIVKDT